MCYNNYDGQSYTSTQYIEPNLLSYDAFGCDSAFLVGSEEYPLGYCKSTDSVTSCKLVMNSAPPSTSPTLYPTDAPSMSKEDYDAIVGTTLAGFSAMAVLNTLLFFFQPPQDTSSVSQNSPTEAGKASEF